MLACTFHINLRFALVRSHRNLFLVIDGWRQTRRGAKRYAGRFQALRLVVREEARDSEARRLARLEVLPQLLSWPVHIFHGRGRRRSRLSHQELSSQDSADLRGAQSPRPQRRRRPAAAPPRPDARPPRGGPRPCCPVRASRRRRRSGRARTALRGLSARGHACGPRELISRRRRPSPISRRRPASLCIGGV